MVIEFLMKGALKRLPSQINCLDDFITVQSTLEARYNAELDLNLDFNGRILTRRDVLVIKMLILE